MLVPEHDPVRYFPVAQLMLEQVEHAVLDVPEHPPLLYLPEPQVEQVVHVPLTVTPAHPCARYWLVVHVGCETRLA